MRPVSIPENIGNRPTICGHEAEIADAMSRPGPLYLSESGIDFEMQAVNPDCEGVLPN